MLNYQQKMRVAAKHLQSNDLKLAPIITAIGPCTIKPHTQYYRELVEAIIGQQLSIKAAKTITGRFVALFDGTFPDASAILGKEVDDFRSAGLSRAKALYVRDLAEHIATGKLDISALPRRSNAEIITELTAIKGIGEWTAHMFLIFSLGRTDVLPVGDLGIRSGMQKLYNLPALPKPQEIHQIALTNHWHPYESVASWYIWQSLTLLAAGRSEN